MTAAPFLLAMFGYALLVVLLFRAMEKVEASAPMTGRREDRRAESAGIALVSAFVLLAILFGVAL